MNDTLLLRVSQEIVGRPLLLLPEKLTIVAGVLAPRLGLDASVEALGPARAEASRFVGTALDEERRERLPYQRTPEGVGVVTVTGSLVNRGAWVGANSGLTSYEGIKHQLARAVADPKVHAVLLDIESPGGQATGAFELAAAIRDASTVKPIDAIVNGMAASAGYALASGARRIVTTPSGISGSIGVVLLHADHSRRLDREGITPTLIQAGAKKTLGHPAQPLTDDARADLQAEVDALYEQFLETVALGRGRRLTANAARATEAGIFTGADAVKAGLADTVGTFEDVLASLTRSVRRSGGSSRTSRSTAMLEFTQADLDRARAEGVAEGRAAAETASRESVAAARAEGATAERERISGILGSEEANSREVSAMHLALKTGLSVEEAKGALAGIEPRQEARTNPATVPRAGNAPLGLVIDGPEPAAGPKKPAIDMTAIYARRAAAGR